MNGNARTAMRSHKTLKISESSSSSCSCTSTSPTASSSSTNSNSSSEFSIPRARFSKTSISIKAKSSSSDSSKPKPNPNPPTTNPETTSTKVKRRAPSPPRKECQQKNTNCTTTITPTTAITKANSSNNNSHHNNSNHNGSRSRFGSTIVVPPPPPPRVVRRESANPNSKSHKEQEPSVIITREKVPKKKKSQRLPSTCSSISCTSSSSEQFYSLDSLSSQRTRRRFIRRRSKRLSLGGVVGASSSSNKKGKQQIMIDEKMFHQKNSQDPNNDTEFELDPLEEREDWFYKERENDYNNEKQQHEKKRKQSLWKPSKNKKGTSNSSTNNIAFTTTTSPSESGSGSDRLRNKYDGGQRPEAVINFRPKFANVNPPIPVPPPLPPNFATIKRGLSLSRNSALAISLINLTSEKYRDPYGSSSKGENYSDDEEEGYNLLSSPVHHSFLQSKTPHRSQSLPRINQAHHHPFLSDEMGDDGDEDGGGSEEDKNRRGSRNSSRMYSKNKHLTFSSSKPTVYNTYSSNPKRSDSYWDLLKKRSSTLTLNFGSNFSFAKYLQNNKKYFSSPTDDKPKLPKGNKSSKKPTGGDDFSNSSICEDCCESRTNSRNSGVGNNIPNTNNWASNLFRSFRFKNLKKKNKISTHPDPGSQTSSPFSNRRYRSKSNPIFASFSTTKKGKDNNNKRTQRTRKASRDFKEVTLDLRNGQLKRSKDGKVLCTVEVKQEADEEGGPRTRHSSSSSSSTRTKFKGKAKGGMIINDNYVNEDKEMMIWKGKGSKDYNNDDDDHSSSEDKGFSSAGSSGGGSNSHNNTAQSPHSSVRNNNHNDDKNLSLSGGDSSSSDSRRTIYASVNKTNKDKSHVHQKKEQSSCGVGKKEHLGTEEFRRRTPSTATKGSNRSSGSSTSSVEVGSPSTRPSGFFFQRSRGRSISSSRGQEEEYENGRGEDGADADGESRLLSTSFQLDCDILGATNGNGNHHRRSSEEELTSLGSIGHIPSSYDGPFDGRAMALVNSQPSPYDNHALKYKKGDIIYIIEKKPSGLWTGKCGDKIGHFKFINVRILPDNLEDGGDPLSSSDPMLQPHSLPPLDPEERHSMACAIIGEEEGQENEKDEEDEGEPETQSKSESCSVSASPSSSNPTTPCRKKKGKAVRKGRPKSVGDLLSRIGLEEHISLFILHGFETLDLFKELEEEDLDRLGIHSEAHRGKILTAVQLLREYDTDSATYCIPKSPPFPPENTSGQTVYQYQYYQQQHTPSRSLASGDDDQEEEDENGPVDFIQTTAVQVHHSYPHQESNNKATYRTSNTTQQPRDSGIFVGKEDDAHLPHHHVHPDVDSEEIILSPINLQQSTSTPTTNNRFPPPSPIFNKRNTSTHATFKPTLPTPIHKNEEGRNRFLQAKSIFEANGFPKPKSNNSHNYDNVEDSSRLTRGGLLKQPARFLFCEKSSDSGISCTNSPPPTLRHDYNNTP